MAAPVAVVEAPYRTLRYAVWIVGAAAAALAVVLLARFQRSWQRARATEEARAAEQRLAHVLESTTDGVIEIDRDWRFVFINERARALVTGGHDYTGRLLWDVFPEAQGSIFHTRYQEVLDTGRQAEFEAHYPPLGMWFSVRAVATSVGFAAYFQDITRRKIAEIEARAAAERLEIAHGRLRRMIDANVVGIITGDADGRIIEANDYYLDLIGFSREELAAGMVRWDVITPPEWRAADERAWEEMRMAGAFRPFEKEYLRRDGRRVWVLLGGAMLPAEPDRGLAFVLDLTAMKQAEAALVEAKAEAERANHSKSRFLATASHDLRQPVQSLFFLLSALEARVEPGAQRTLSHATEALTALKSLLDSLLDISRLDAGTIEPQVEEFALSTLLDQIDAEYRPLAEAKGVDWHVVGSAARVRSDPALLGRMLRNLCQNAIRYTSAGGVRVLCRAVGDSLKVEVADTGVGIPPERLNDIFEEFQQIGNEHRDRTQGLGLGLAIVRRLSMLLGHRVEVRSTPGEGSVFSVAVPMAVDPAAPGEEVSAIPAAHGDGRLVVVIDDEDLVRFGLTTLIGIWGYGVLDVASGAQAAAALQRGGLVPEVLVSDYRLAGGKNGIDAIRSIRALFQRPIPAVLLTGETSHECATEAAMEGITVLHKPIVPSQLQALLAAKTSAAAEALD